MTIRLFLFRSMISITPYQVLVPLFSLTMMAYAWNLVLRQKKTIWEAGLWTLFWLVIAYVSLFPSSLQFLSDVTGIKKNENALVFTAIGILFFAIFYLVLRLETLEQRIVQLTREKALKDAGVEGVQNQEKSFKL